MRFGDQDYEIGPISADVLIRLVKFGTNLFQEVDEDQKAALLEQVQRSNVLSLLNILSSKHIYSLTSILLGISKAKVKEHWTLVAFTEMIADLSEHNDLPGILKNVQRAVASFQD